MLGGQALHYITATISVNMPQIRTETKDMDVKVAIDRCMLGWLAAVTKEKPKVVMCHLYDLTTNGLEDLIKRNGTWASRKVVFPGTDIKLKVTSSRYTDNQAYFRARDIWREKSRAENEGEDPKHQVVPKKWKDDNPVPDHYGDPRWNYVRCKFTLLNGETEIVMSQHEMDTLMTETFLLGDPDE
jgi:hypothetical protein